MQRLLALDSIRGLAALGVLLFHYTTRFHSLYGHNRDLGFWFPNGLYFVDIFFILSGYLLTQSLSRPTSCLRFITLRLARLAPAFWACTILTFIATTVHFLPGRSVSFLEFLGNLTLVPGLVRVAPVDAVVWSIQVELHFYSILAASLLFGLIHRLEWVLLLWVCVALFIPLPELQPSNLPWLIEKLRNGVFVFTALQHAHLFILGSLLFLTLQGKNPYLLTLISILAVCAGFRYRDHVYMCVALSSWILIALAVKGRLAILVNRPLILLGMISYPLYLLHQNLGYLVMLTLESWGLHAWLAISCALVLSLGLAALITFTIELPMLQFARKKIRGAQNMGSRIPSRV